MNVEYTGRQYEITPAVRKQIEHGLAKIKKLLGDNFDTHVILAVEKHRHKAEITITLRDHPMVGAAESSDMSSAGRTTSEVATSLSPTLVPRVRTNLSTSVTACLKAASSPALIAATRFWS